MLNELISEVRVLLASTNERPVLVVIDGPAGAGKSTLAARIVEEIGAGEIIHCDDLYNGWDDALTETFQEHLQQWILDPLSQGQMPRYQKYDWSSRAFSPSVALGRSALIILEGVGCAIEKVTKAADLTIWIDIPYHVGLERVLQRDGEEIRNEMLRWLDRQREYFELNSNRENCDIHIDQPSYL